MIWILTHRRSGTWFFIKSIKKNFEVELKNNHCLPRRVGTVDESQYRYVGEGKKIYIVRDGRDVLVSCFYWTKTSGEAHRQWSGRLSDKDWSEFSEFLRSPIFMHQNLKRGECRNPIEYWKKHVETWLEDGRIYWTYEGLHKQDRKTLKMIGEYYELEAKPGADFTKVEKLVGCDPRKGIIGDWKNHFNKEDLEFFNSICGGLMERLGYE